MKVDNVITLDNDKKYLLLDETKYENSKYYYAIEVDGDPLKPTENYAFLQEKKENDKYFIAEIEDDETKATLLVIFMNSIGLKIDEMFNEQ